MAPSTMPSRLYECRVTHARLAPVRHRFTYRLFLLAIDLDELPRLDRELRGFSLRGRSLYSLRLDDYLPLGEPRHPDGARPPATTPLTALSDRVRHLLAEHGLDPGPAPRVLLVTMPRVLGYSFNPVSFYFCSRADGTPVGAIAEVTNTFREIKPYVLRPQARRAGGAATFSERIEKAFYVSPFSRLDQEFHFHLRTPDDRLAVRIDAGSGDGRTLTSTLSGRARPLTTAALARLTLLYPLLTLQVIVGIHWQALRLYLKRAPWVRKADRPDQQRGLYRPHAAAAARPSPLA